jgi:tetratricopeptide (TPR) repeat protein
VKLTAVIFALLFAISARPGSTATAGDVWLKAQSKHFTLIGNAGEKDIRKVGTRLEQFRAAFSRLFPQSEAVPAIPITVIVFKNDETYRPFKPLYQGRPSDVSGYFQSSDDAAYITLAADWRRTNPYAVIFHEYVHALMGAGLGRLPVWLDEGIAEFYGAFEVAGGGRSVALGRAIASHVRLLREGRFLPLETLFAVDRASPLYNEAEKKSLFYAESWALVHYLLLGEGGKRQSQFRRFINALAQNRPVDEIFKEAFQADYATIERELQNYVSRSAWPSEYVTLEEKLVFDASMRWSPIGEAEVEAYLGDLLWRIHRSADGEELLQRAISIEPRLAMAHYSLGMLRMRQNRYGESKQHFQRAAEADSQNHLAHYYYAFALHREQVDESQYVSEFPAETVKTMRAALNRARELEPNFADAYKLLAFINLVLGEDLDEAVKLIRRAMALAPKREDFVYTLAQIQMRQKDYGAAKQTVQALAESAVKSDVRERARSLLEVIAKVEEQVAKMKAESLSRGNGSPSSPEPASSRPPLPGQRFQGDQVRGFLIRIDCDDASITLTVKSGARIFKLHTSQPGQLIFVRYTPEIPTSMICGAINPAKPVIVTYRTSTQSKFDGEPIGVEFVKPEE